MKFSVETPDHEPIACMVEGCTDEHNVLPVSYTHLDVYKRQVEFRNFAIMRCLDDAMSLDTENSNIWIHHLDLFYGRKGRCV